MAKKLNLVDMYGIGLMLEHLVAEGNITCEERDRVILRIARENDIFRFCIEFFRGDAIRGFFLGFSTAQWVSLAIIICYVYRHFKTCRTRRKTEAIQSELHPSDREKGGY